MKIYVGDKVRSHDFPREQGLDRPPCFVEGTVVGIEKIEGCDRYKIQVERKVWAGEEVEDPYDGYVYPPVNGTPKLFGGVCDGVERIL